MVCHPPLHARHVAASAPFAQPKAAETGGSECVTVGRQLTSANGAKNGTRHGSASHTHTHTPRRPGKWPGTAAASTSGGWPAAGIRLGRSKRFIEPTAPHTNGSLGCRRLPQSRSSWARARDACAATAGQPTPASRPLARFFFTSHARHCAPRPPAERGQAQNTGAGRCKLDRKCTLARPPLFRRADEEAPLPSVLLPTLFQPASTRFPLGGVLARRALDSGCALHRCAT